MKYKKKILLTILWIFIIGFLYTLVANVFIIESTKKQIIDINELEKIDDVSAILVLGCKAHEDNTPSLMLANRLEKGIEVYNLTSKKLILSGDHAKDGYDEVNTMRDYVLNSTIPSKDIFLDHAGLTTYDSIYRAKYIFEAKKIVIITQKYHLYRALYLANQIGIEAVGVVAEDIPQKSLMVKNNMREVFSRDKNFIKGIIKPQSKYLGEKISLDGDGNVTEG